MSFYRIYKTLSWKRWNAEIKRRQANKDLKVFDRDFLVYLKVKSGYVVMSN